MDIRILDKPKEQERAWANDAWFYVAPKSRDHNTHAGKAYSIRNIRWDSIVPETRHTAPPI